MPAFFRQTLCSFGVHCVRTRKRGVPGVFGSRLKTPFLRIRLTALDLVEEELVIESIKERVVPVRVLSVRDLDQDLTSALRA